MKLFLSRPTCIGLLLLMFVFVPHVLLSQDRTLAPSNLDSTLIKSTVESAGEEISQQYFDPALAARLNTALHQWLAEGRYANLKTPEALASSLTNDLESFSHDKHLAVNAIPTNIDAAHGGLGASQQSREEEVRMSNAGVQRVEIMPGNVGYLNITTFFRPEEESDAIATAMHLLRHTDALILDMRDNSGGSPDTLALLASYFFDSPKVPLFDETPRYGEVQHYATQGEIADRDGNRPLYVLTSAHTWSAGEGIAFALQEHHRAEIIGETTVGAANPGRPYRLNTTFSITIPNGHISSAVRGTNWEGIGVVPDTSVPASDALRVAQTHALRQLLSQAPPGLAHDLLQQELGKLDEPQQLR